MRVMMRVKMMKNNSYSKQAKKVGGEKAFYRRKICGIKRRATMDGLHNFNLHYSSPREKTNSRKTKTYYN